jgi:nucleotide-binding universal stress UspA family protein
MPVFFGMAGLSADLTVLTDPTLLLLTVGLVLNASVGKYGGAFAGGKLAGMSWKEATAVGCAMNARGSTEVIVATIGLTMGILSHNLFTMIVTMAVITTLAMPPMLRWALGRIPMGEAEKERVEREVLDQRGFVSKLERLLLAADDSSIGRFTAYVAGLIGGSSGMPTTLLRLTGTSAAADGTDKGTESHLEEIKKGAEASATAVERAEDVPVEKVHLTARTESGPTGKIIAQEARKGYDMLIVGLGKALTPKGAFTRKINDVTGGFDGPLCLVVRGAASGKSKMPALTADETILVPVNGTDVSRRAADVALAIARPHRSRVKVLYVSPQRKGGRDSLSHRREEAVLKDIVDLAERYDVPVVTAMRVRGAAAESICKEAARGAALVVLGASQRPGDELFFGDTASAVISGCTVPVILVSGERVSREEKRQEKDTAEAAKKEAEKAERRSGRQRRRAPAGPRSSSTSQRPSKLGTEQRKRPGRRRLRRNQNAVESDHTPKVPLLRQTCAASTSPMVLTPSSAMSRSSSSARSLIACCTPASPA